MEKEGYDLQITKLYLEKIKLIVNNLSLRKDLKDIASTIRYDLKEISEELGTIYELSK